MKHFYGLGVFWICMAILMGCSMIKKESNQLPVLAGVGGLNLTPVEEQRLLVESEKDDGTAAFRLSNYYSFVKGDHPEAMKWLKKSASRGHAQAQYNLGILILEKVYPDDPTMNDPREGKYWLELSAKNGYIEAKEALKKLEPQIQPAQPSSKPKRGPR